MWCDLQYKQVAPVGDRVFVKIDKEEEKTSSGILLPSSAQKKPTQGEIVTAGDAKALKASIHHSHRFQSLRGCWSAMRQIDAVFPGSGSTWEALHLEG